ncbi:tyrosine-type recombinase/integrase [Saccharothrix luteola]|uniref:tyrosine-type recombinase/integrase n=1 Tax=Saccharothrix luteola TaxID=2893018 RepID=UPI001E352663|nr:site-specific integrase [Saccharothrix luteola]MCC8250193.1 site-specific integrase [Saccharothrix luteola]
MADGGYRSADVAMAIQLLQHMNLRPQDLIDDMASVVGREVPDDGGVSTGRDAPTFAEIVPEVAGAVPSTTRKAYDAYWKKIVAVWGERRLDEITVSDVQSLFEYVKSTVVVRRTANGGRSAVQHTYNALLCVYRYAVGEEVITDRQNVMSRVAKPSRSHSRRHGLDAALVGRIVEVASSTGNDPALDALLLRLHLETACRRGGALALRVRDLDSEQCLILLREKGGGSRWQPVSPTLMAHLRHHARARGACDPDSHVLRYHNGRPMSRVRYTMLWRRVGEHVESVRTQVISAHWLRHTTLTWVERNFGYAVARAFAGHAEPTSNRYGVTSTYVKASLTEIATAVQALTGERHPLAVPEESSAARAEDPIVRTALADFAPTGVSVAAGGEHRSAFGPLTGAAVAASPVQVDTDRSAAPVDVDMEPGGVDGGVYMPEVLVLLAEVIGEDESGIVATADLADRIGWDPKRLGQALWKLNIPAPSPPRQRVGDQRRASVRDIDTIVAAIRSWTRSR